MINLLPSELKQELVYAKRNALLMRYIWIAGITLLISCGGLAGGQYYLHQRIAHATSDLADNQTRIASYAPTVQRATELNQRIRTIESIQKNQAHFSQLLSDLSQYMPSGTVLTSIGLTGDDTKPVALIISASTYENAVAFRDSLIKSRRVQAADIGAILPNTDSASAARYPYQVHVTFSFSKGAAK